MSQFGQAKYAAIRLACLPLKSFFCPPADAKANLGVCVCVAVNMSRNVSLFEAPTSAAAVNAMAAVRDYHGQLQVNPRARARARARLGAKLQLHACGGSVGACRQWSSLLADYSTVSGVRGPLVILDNIKA